jgi:hypothetical protein
MKLGEITQLAHWSCTIPNSFDSSLSFKEAVHVCKPHLVVSLRPREILHEVNYKRILKMIDPNHKFSLKGLTHKQRADILKGSWFQGFDDQSDDTMIFHVPSSNYAENGIKYLNQIKFLQWEDTVHDRTLTPTEVARLLTWVGDIQLQCECPAFLYYGYEFILSRLNAALHKEERPPVVNNPEEVGSVCKHMDRTLKAFPFHMGDLSRHVKQIRDILDAE